MGEIEGTADASSGHIPRLRLQRVDALRGVAALVVVLTHIPHYPSDLASVPLVFVGLVLNFGYLGVPMFLLISGFCIHLRNARRMDEPAQLHVDWASFWKRRMWRLYPPYLVAIVYSLALYSLTDTTVINQALVITNFKWDLITHLLLIHNLFKAYVEGLGNAPFWTLGLEEQLYALYALYLFLRGRLSARTTLLIGIGLTLCFRIWTAWTCYSHATFGWPPFELSRMDKWPFAHWAAWLCGAVVAEVYAGVVKLPRWCSSLWALGLFLLAGLLLNSQTLGRLAGSRFAAATLSASPAACFAMQCLYEFSDLLFAFGFLILLNRWVSADRNGRPLSGPVRWLQWIGIFSYSLYLVHLPLIHVSETIFVHLGMGNRFWENGLRYAVMLPLSLLCGWLFFMLVERWFLGRPQARQAGSVSPQLERTGG